MSDATWALFDASGRLVGQTVTSGATPTMAEIGFARPVRTARQADLSIEAVDPATGAIAEVPALVEALLIAAVKTEAEQRKMERATAGGYKKTEYAEKAREIANADALGTTAAAILAALGALSPAQQVARFPYAAASAAAFGDTVAKALDRFRVGQARAASVTRIAAAEERACAQIRAATTAAAKRAAFTAITWG